MVASQQAEIGPWRRIFQKLWLPVRNHWRSVSDLRFTAALLLIGALLVVSVPPGRDVVATISDTPWTLRWWLFVAAVWFLGLQAWLWSRLLIQLRHGDRHDWRKKRLLVWLPRVLGLVPYIAAAIALLRVPEGGGRPAQAAVLLVLALLALSFYWYRFRITAALGSWRLARFLFQDPVGSLGLARFEWWILALSLVLSLATLIWLALDPVTLPLAIGSAALAFLAFALVLPLVNGLIALTWRERFPVLTFLLVLALLSSFFNDNHGIRRLDAQVPPPRPQFDEAYEQWLSQSPHAQKWLEQGSQAGGAPKEVPVVLVSAAGGASRAGLWTLAALQRLDRMDPNFSRSVFAVSAVSGSALGAIDFVASIQADEAEGRTGGAALAWDHASRDFLAPALGGMLYTDFVQRFIPFPFLRDRSESIERGFEEGWARSCREAGRGERCEAMLRRSFLELWPAQRRRWRPNLLLIGTVEEDGRRIVTSNIDLVREVALARGRRAAPVLPQVYDFYRVTNGDIAASTAIMNSARFPWISPAGGVGLGQGRSFHIIDGGYFEASATETSMDLAAALRQAEQRACKGGSARPCLTLRPIYLTLLNTDLPDDMGSGYFEEGRISPVERSIPAGRRRPFANDLFGPLIGLFSVQNSRAEATMARLSRLDADQRGRAAGGQLGQTPVVIAAGQGLEVRILPCRASGDRPLALNWVLSAPTRKRMTDRLEPLVYAPAPPPTVPPCQRALQQEVSRLARALALPRE